MSLATAFDFVGLVPLLPLLGTAGIALHILTGRAAGDAAEAPTVRIAGGTCLLALLLLLALDAAALAGGWPGQVNLGTWFASGEMRIPLSFTLDRLSLPLATLVALIAWITLRFSARYLHREAGIHRFFLVMNLFVAGMLLILLAGNAVLAFVGWELAGISSYLLIGYAYERPTATGNALFVFVTNRIGDAGFLLGIALAMLLAGSVEWPAINAGDGRHVLTSRLLAIGFVLAALVKSAQLPFAPWITRALEGPTPSSAIFYGAVMVHAGVYLVLRLEPLLWQVPDAMMILAAVGAATALYGWVSGLAQTDVKSALIFGTTTQVGLMFLACGLGWFEVAAWHLGLHAAWRAYQFLMAPSYMHLIDAAARPAPPWLARRLWLYTAALQRFWLEHLAQGLLVRPLQAVGRDMRSFDDNVLSHLVGMPQDVAAGTAARQRTEEDDEVIRGRGLAGRMLVWTADRLHRFEGRLLLRGSGGTAADLMRRAAAYFLVIETMLERPRYLLLLVAATFVVIL